MRHGFPLRPGRHLYVFQNVITGNVKIGSTNDVERRCRELENAAGMPLEILRVVEDEGDMEPHLHEALDDFRLPLGEWFKPDLLILDWCASKESPDELCLAASLDAMDRPDEDEEEAV